MSSTKTPTFSTYGGYGQQLLQQMGYNQAVRIGDRIETAGQGGWNPETGEIPASLDEEIDQAFSNVDLALRSAGGKGWSQVYRIRLYALEPEGFTEEGLHRMVQNMDKWCGKRPILTGVGVSKLGQPGMRFEIEVAAYAPEEE
ncbi:Endoribonuclease L-PSP/chorismate mutase-like protein [Microdochium trichocladiopsis]|uniref:Endoribonuclease L-PSP/chorismate mutase-like protein n=1 Tax=Microdochium trichocladiopsis TaxID=1682393 RepID=A0A9P9BP86_9PEZI|nr:Endoribonuclease L-PSP/chorismate mutase-like protein [Microdochium trichocladiopsis]KAH7028992.1 Endoribonuclease L-PSP/chorismate mutase-like protein [Microdochium trichocladiopsis]